MVVNRKADILDSAERLLRTRGHDGFSYADIEKDVGIRKASIHHHYAKKSDLVLSLIQRYCGRLEQNLENIARREQTAAGRLTDFLDSYRATLSGGESLCLCVALSVTTANLSTPVREQLDSYRSGSIEWLKAVFTLAREDKSITGIGDAEAEATACLALVEGAMLMGRVSRNSMRFEAAVAQLRQRIVLNPVQ